MLELPTKTMAFFGTGDAVSLASNTTMSFSHFSGRAGTVCAAWTGFVKHTTDKIDRIDVAMSAAICFGDFIGGMAYFGCRWRLATSEAACKAFWSAFLAIMHL